MFINWIESYLRYRKQIVIINGVSSESINVYSGVPQGSHLGPILFIMFINEVSQLFKYSDCLLYADDLKLFKEISSDQNWLDLQFDLDLLHEWCIKHKLDLNISKCKVMSFAMIKKPTYRNYSIGNVPIERVSSFKDLGVHLDEQLTFRDHIDEIVNKSNCMLGFVKRITKDFHNPLSIKSLYCALIRSNLEYASIIWNPKYNIDDNRIERIQKRFILYYLHKTDWSFDQNIPLWQTTRMLPAYSERCNIAELHSLSLRRKVAITLFASDIISGRVDVPELLAKISIRIPAKPVRNHSFIYLSTFQSNYLFNAPFPTICRNFNQFFTLYDFNMSKVIFKNVLYKN